MDIKVLEVDDLPANTFLSLRYGDIRKQAPFRAGESFAFPPSGKQPKAFTVDVFQKVASSQVSLAGISALGGSLNNVEIETLDIGSAPLKASFEASLRSFDHQEKSGASRGRNAAERAKQYMEQRGVQHFLQEMFTQLLERKPEDYLGFLADFIEQKQDEADHADRNEIDFSSEPGLGENPLPGFAAFPLPDLGKHNSIATEVLRAQPEIEQLADLRTSMGVSLAQCIKPGVDCPGHPMVKVAGAFAGDAECYSMFHQFFDPLVASLSLKGSVRSGDGATHPLDGDVSKISSDQIDPSGSYVVYAVLEARRNVEGIRMPVSCSKEERREVEKLLSSARLRGTYLPLAGSKSWPKRLGGMAAFQEERLRKVEMLLTEPDSKLKLAAGFGRHWPDARGVMVCDAPGVFVWCNEEDHYRFFARQEGSEIKELYERMAKTMSAVSEAATMAGRAFASSSKLGWLTTCPSRVGAALRVTLTLRIPLLAKAVELPALCECLHLHCDSSSSAISGNLWQIHSLSSLGVSEVEVMNEMIQGCKLLVGLEQRLERKEPIFDALPGLGRELPFSPLPCQGPCPEAMPDLAGCRSLVAASLRVNPKLYLQYRSLATSSGTHLGVCLRPAFDRDVGRQKTASGLVAGDEECLDTFRDLFVAVHGQLQALQASWEPPRGSWTSVELTSSCQWVKIEMRRNVSGLRFAPSCSTDERREVERLLVRCMENQKAVTGQYYPLAFSQSYPLMPNGINQQEERHLVRLGKLFPAPHALGELSSGVGREWPDARGAFLSDGTADDGCETLAWVNQADHLRLRCFVPGGDMQLAYRKVQGMADNIETELNSLCSRGFSRHAKFGYVTVDSLHLGSGMQLTAAMQLPELSQLEDFPKLCARLKLTQTWHDDGYELSSYPAPELKAEDLLARTLQSLRILAGLDQSLADGQNVQPDLEALGVI
mmetsp:Transcript_69687/g.166352  ORF Transcript_69687/g.166352 Transcript_69687/m.166352 type:complete len:941 (-) Transcript_69687:73-2895(-)